MRKDNLTDLATTIGNSNNNPQGPNQDQSQPVNPPQNLADNQVIGNNGEVIDLSNPSYDIKKDN